LSKVFISITNRKGPTFASNFFPYKNISREQYKKIINELERKKIKYILVSNRLRSKISPNGNLNQNFAPSFNQYLYDNFKIMKIFGTWGEGADWVRNHGTVILKRK